MQAGTAVGNLAGVIGVRPEEAAIVEQLKAGSEEAFAWLISRYQQPLYSLIYRVLPNPGDAADITQEVFVKVFRGIGHFHGEASLRTWVYRIALHEALNQRRWWSRHQRQQVAIDDDTDDQHAIPPRQLSSIRTIRPSIPPLSLKFPPASKPPCAKSPNPSAPSSFCATSRASATKKSPKFLTPISEPSSRASCAAAPTSRIFWRHYMEAASRRPSRPSPVPRACSA